MTEVMEKKIEWHSETWQKMGKGFLVEIKHWKTEGYDPDTKEWPIVNRWNVYAYIYPKHPIFKQLEEDKLFIDHDITEFFHCGLSYHNWNYDKDGNVTGKQLGSDYQHLHDNYEKCDNIEFTPTQRDAENLFNYLMEAQS